MKVMFSSRTMKILAAVLLLAVSSRAAAVAQSAGQKSSGSRSGAPPQPSRKAAADQAPELRLGKLDRAPGRSASLPVFLKLVDGKSAGSVSAEVVVPRGAWVFQSAETPTGAWWKISSKEKPAPATGPRAASIIELNISGGNRALQEGLIGSLIFAVDPPGSPAPAGLIIRPLRAAAPGTVVAKPGAGGTREPDMPAQPPAPVPACFFFSH